MIYSIESKSDLTGAMLVIRFPVEDLDAKALYTIQSDQPDFLVPFRYRCVDGQAECAYQLGRRIKLVYRCSSKSPGELAAFWERVLQPLLDCGDWFCKPFSFVLDPQYLYTDREGNLVSYIYVPSKRDCTGMRDLQKMVEDLAQKNPPADAGLEVKVLRAIMQDFQPRSFLQMLRKIQPHPPVAEPLPPSPPERPSPQPALPNAPEPEPETPKFAEGEDIRIDISGGKKEKKEKKGLFGRKEEKKKEKKPPKPQKEGGLFGKKKEPSKELLLGAAGETPAANPAPFDVPFVQGKGFEVTEKNGDTVDGETVLLDETEAEGAYFRLVGDQTLPWKIPVSLPVGGVFSIGRYDVTVGRRQSDFEFEGKTKAVSRYHAAVERTEEGYTVSDLDSTAGTYVDGERLTPNVPRALTRGCRVSFGTAGADYIWEG